MTGVRAPLVAGVGGGVGTTTVAAGLHGRDGGRARVDEADVLVCRDTLESLDRAAAVLDRAGPDPRPVLTVTLDGARLPRGPLRDRVLLLEEETSGVLLLPRVRHWRTLPDPLAEAAALLVEPAEQLPRALRPYAAALRELAVAVAESGRLRRGGTSAGGGQVRGTSPGTARPPDPPAPPGPVRGAASPHRPRIGARPPLMQPGPTAAAPAAGGHTPDHHPAGGHAAGAHPAGGPMAGAPPTGGSPTAGSSTHEPPTRRVSVSGPATGGPPTGGSPQRGVRIVAVSPRGGPVATAPVRSPRAGATSGWPAAPAEWTERAG